MRKRTKRWQLASSVCMLQLLLVASGLGCATCSVTRSSGKACNSFRKALLHAVTHYLHNASDQACLRTVCTTACV